jgi:thiamine biosynthesis protein ThiI
MERAVVVHHSEIVLKGRKRSCFETLLLDNIRYVLGPGMEVVRDENRLVIFNPPEQPEPLVEKLRKVFGVSHIGVGYRTEPRPEKIIDVARLVLEETRPKSIVFDVKRSYKQHPFTSQDIRLRLSKMARDELGIDVGGEAEATARVEITRQNAYVYVRRGEGYGGLPVGSSGKVLSLVSGGVDSAVATLLVRRRGCRASLLHFHSYRSAEEALQAKMYGLKMGLYMASFTPFYRVVHEKPSRLELLLFRKYMLKVAEKIAAERGYRAVVLGDSLAQVASQTLANIIAVKPQLNIEVFRLLIGLSKTEIFGLAERFSILEIVQKPYKDCRSIVASRPVTKADPEDVEEEWNRLGLESAVEETLKNIEEYVSTYRAGLFRQVQAAKTPYQPRGGG